MESMIVGKSEKRPTGRAGPAREQRVPAEQHARGSDRTGTPRRASARRVQHLDVVPADRDTCPSARSPSGIRPRVRAPRAGRPGAATRARRSWSASAGATRCGRRARGCRTMARTRRPPTTVAMAAASCGGVDDTHSSSSPTTQTLLSTSQVPPSRLNVPDVTTRSTGRQPLKSTTERRTSPRCILCEGLLDVARGRSSR